MGENEASALQAPDDATWDVTGLTREQDVGVALSSIAHYAREHDLTGREVLDVFSAGIVAMCSSFEEGRQVLKDLRLEPVAEGAKGE